MPAQFRAATLAVGKPCMLRVANCALTCESGTPKAPAVAIARLLPSVKSFMVQFELATALCHVSM